MVSCSTFLLKKNTKGIQLLPLTEIMPARIIQIIKIIDPVCDGTQTQLEDTCNETSLFEQFFFA
jgi:hypothetical protein